MFSKIRHYNPDLPVLKLSLPAFRWSLLFLYDLIFGITSNKKSENGKVLKKIESNSSIARKFKKLHDLNVDRLLKVNREHKFDSKLKLPEVDSKDFDAELFKKWKNKAYMPIVIRGFLKDAPTIDLLSKESLANNYGDVDIKCVTLMHESADESRAGQNFNTVDAKMKEFIMSDEFENYYINNFYGILNDEDFLNLCKGKEVDEIQGQSYLFNQWFISRSENKGSTLHCAQGDNMFLNIKGQKEWHFIHPSYTPIMQATLSKYGVFAVSEMDEPIEGDVYENITKAHSYMKNVPIFRVLLEEGDMLYNPPWWWHSVRNKASFTVGCATRYWEYKYSSQGSPTLANGSAVEFLKNPRKSFLYKTYKLLLNRKSAPKFVDSIFSGKD